ncbi:MAG: hypothetical protein JOZ78_19760 [Chroococcidiopsidaceae cyanobacterium CP_BM_ER_R8_30]|nr:hypothetical protein [Chroococcidiopsidaceae cyanobacterium CP_BM_ER_R8_30]
MISSHLENEKAAIQAHIEMIRNSGAVAPIGAKIVPNFLHNKHWMIQGTDLPFKERDLGLHGSAKYHDWEERIHRRNQIQALEEQLALLQRLMDLQTQAETIFAETPSTIDVGDLVEYQGKQYSVNDVGFRYLQLVNTDGHIFRCEISQAQLLTKTSYRMSPDGNECYLTA